MYFQNVALSLSLSHSHSLGWCQLPEALMLRWSLMASDFNIGVTFFYFLSMFTCCVVFLLLPQYLLNVLFLSFSLSPCWCQSPEAPTFGWRDKSLMASDFNICVPSPHQCLCVVLSLFFSSLLAFCIHFSRSLLTSVVWSSHPPVAWRVADGFWF